LKLVKYVKPNGKEIEIGDFKENIKYVEDLGWKPAKEPAKAAASGATTKQQKSKE